MALSENLPIYKDGYDLLERLTDLAENLPKFYRFSYGYRMIDTCLDLLDLVYRANISIEKRQEMLIELLSYYRRLQMMLRVCFHRKAISSGRYAELILLLDSIGKQATAWKNSTEVRNDG